MHCMFKRKPCSLEMCTACIRHLWEGPFTILVAIGVWQGRETLHLSCINRIHSQDDCEISCILAYYSQVLHFNNNSNDCNDTFPLYRTFHPKGSYSYSLAVTKEVGNTQCKAAIFITLSVGCGMFHTIQAILESTILLLLLLCNPSTVQTLCLLLLQHCICDTTVKCEGVAIYRA